MKRLITLVFAATLVLALAPTTLATSSDSGTVYWDRGSCLGTADSDAAGTVTFNRDGKWLSGSVSLSGVPDDGTYGMLVFVLSEGTCPQGKGLFVGQIVVSAGAGSASIGSFKIPGSRDGHDVTFVLCIGGNSAAPGFHFSEPVTLGP
jgi:hypothetical protein